MALDHHHVQEDGSHTSRHRQLMPNAMANGLRDRVRQVVGAALLATILVSWLSFLSWSIDDPSLFHATTLAPHNWLGRPGAIGADLLLQTFGIAALAALLPPMFWGAALLQRQAVTKLARNLSAYLAAIVSLASAAASLPIPRSWPLHHGLGGIIGDALFLVASAPFAVANAEYGRPAAGIVLLAIGLGCAWIGVGGTASGLSHGLIKTQRVKTHRTRPAKSGITDRTQPSMIHQLKMESSLSHWK